MGIGFRDNSYTPTVLDPVTGSRPNCGGAPKMVKAEKASTIYLKNEANVNQMTLNFNEQKLFN